MLFFDLSIIKLGILHLIKRHVHPSRDTFDFLQEHVIPKQPMKPVLRETGTASVKRCVCLENSDVCIYIYNSMTE